MGTKYKRRIGDRSDGRRIRTLQPMNAITPYLMKRRNGAHNQIKVTVDIDNMEKYILKKREEGLKGFGALHVILAMYVRAVSKMPGLNRFVSGQRIYARNDIQVMMTVKKEMKLNADETCVKAHFDPSDDVNTVYEKFSKLIAENKNIEEENSMDGVAKVFNFIPRILLRAVVSFIEFLDYFGLLPKFLLEVSPFHGSMFITSMGSLGIPAIFHHLYDFGNCPIFCCYGAKYSAFVTNKDGSVSKKKFMDFTFVLDERTVDGHYYASALKLMLSYLKDPEKLDNEEIVVVEDIK